MKTLCVYCGSSDGARPIYGEVAEALGAELGRRDLALVYGGAGIGLMGRLADSVLAAGGRVVGVIPRAMVARELAHPGLSELHVVDSMHERKRRMAEIADGFIALPGGLGTLEELFEVLTWSQLGIHRKPCALLNTQGYYDRLLQWLAHAAQERFVSSFDSSRLIVSDDSPSALIEAMLTHETPSASKNSRTLDWDQI